MKSFTALLAAALLLPGAAFAGGVADHVANLSSPDPVTRETAALELCDLGPDAAAAVPALRKALKDTSLSVRQASAAALGEIGEAARPALDDLLAFTLGNDDPGLRETGWGALTLLGQGSELAPKLEASYAGGSLSPRDLFRLVEILGEAVVPLVTRAVTSDSEAWRIAAADAVTAFPYQDDEIEIVHERLVSGLDLGGCEDCGETCDEDCETWADGEDCEDDQDCEACEDEGCEECVDVEDSESDEDCEACQDEGCEECEDVGWLEFDPDLSPEDLEALVDEVPAGALLGGGFAFEDGGGAGGVLSFGDPSEMAWTLPKPLVQGLAAMLDRESERVAALEALGAIGPQAQETIGAIAALLATDAGLAALEALSTFDDLAPAEAALIAALTGPQADVRGGVSSLLQSLPSAQVTAALVAALKHEDRVVRGEAAVALAQREGDQRVIVQALIALLERDGPPRARAEGDFAFGYGDPSEGAAHALGQIARRDPNVVADVGQDVKDEEVHEAVGRILERASR